MNSRERVLASLKHKQPDRTPCGYVSTPEINLLLRKHFQVDAVETDCCVMGTSYTDHESKQQMDAVFDQLGVDFRFVGAFYTGPKLKQWPDGRFEDIWGVIRKPVSNMTATYYEATDFPYAAFTSAADVEKFRWPKEEWFDFSTIPAQCAKYKEYAIVFGSPGNMDLINGTAFGRGVEQVLYDIAVEDPVGLACMEKRFECCYTLTERALITASGKIDIVWIGDDYGHQNGLIINPKSLRKLFFPKLRKMCDLIHKYNAKVMLHSCGATRPIWPDLIDAGVDIYDTVQPEAQGMDPEELKLLFGNKICFHGTISLQKVLPFGTAADVAEYVTKRIQNVGRNGGLILAPANAFQPDTPLENILTMYKTVRESKNVL